MEYPKIETLFDRKENHKVDETRIRCPEFSAINSWWITEKIDGTNIRIIFERENANQPATNKPLDIRGRTDNATLPEHIKEIFKSHTFDAGRWDSLMQMGMGKMIIYGEACGSKIQNGGLYETKDKKRRFLVFDIWIDGWWLEWPTILRICNNLNLETVPLLPYFTIKEALAAVKRNERSLVGEIEHAFEGVVATSNPLMLFRDGRPIKWKLKCRDFY